MIGYFLKSGDEVVSKLFSPYLWEEHGFQTFCKNAISNKSYGEGLKLLLIMYYVEGEFAINGPTNPTVSNYSNKSQEISVSITVKRYMFQDWNEYDRRKYIISSTVDAIKLVQEKLEKKKINIRFNELLSDIIEIGNSYLKQEAPIYKSK